MERREARLRVEQPTCPFCRSEMAAGEAQLACNRCRAWHHGACWTENGARCAACGGQDTGLHAVRPAAPAPATRPRYTTRSGRAYEYSVPFGLWTLQRLGILALSSAAFAAVGVGLQERPAAMWIGVALVFAGVVGALRRHERRTRRYL